MTLSDPSRALLQRWVRGDRTAGSRLLSLHFDALARFFANKVGEEVEELIQRTLEACVRYIDRLEQAQSFKAYLFTIARHELYRFLRERYRRPELDGEMVSVADLGTSPTSMVARREQQRVLLEALRSLPLELQITVELHYWEGLSTAELAEVLEIPHGTAKSRIRKAKQLLTKRLTASQPRPVDPLETADSLPQWVRELRQLVDVRPS